ncbi:hypothetical protein K456DRAFT_1731707 [Colletotrichum gloeosporioides 23]|nr:hypothetical protein K456DRAFT_1731707 [Colletotrichum gloeosporioides 23]
MARMTATIEGIIRERLCRLDEADLSERQQLLDTVLQACDSEPSLDGWRRQLQLEVLNNAVSWCSLLVMDIALLKDLHAKLRDPAQRIRAFREFTNCLMFADSETYDPYWGDFADNRGFRVPGDDESRIQELVEMIWDAANRTTRATFNV